MANVLLVGFSSSTNKKLAGYFDSVQVKCETAPQLHTAIEKIPAGPPSLILAQKPDDLRELQGLQEVLRVHAPITPFLVLLKKPSANDALAVMKVGAYECLPIDVDRYHMLAAAKRATGRMGHTLFVKKVIPKKSPITFMTFCALVFVGFMALMVRIYNGPPNKIILLGSANLSGLQWQDRELWVGDWFDSTITEYVLKKNFLPTSRVLISKNIFKMQDGQPILMAVAPEFIFTISTDLKIRSHQKSVGLPTLQTREVPAANPTGLAWDGKFLWSSDAQSNLLYKHSEDLRVVETVKSILTPIHGLTYDGENFWIVGGSPLKLARLKVTSKGRIWSGPYPIDQILTEGVMPTGVTIGFDRLWLVSGGDPKMVSKPLADVTKTLTGWAAAPKKTP